MTLVKEDIRAAWGWQRLEQLARDVRFGLRQIRRTPGFSAIAILTLALGIGGVTAVFSAFYAVLIRPLPYADADRLVVIWDEEARAQISKQFVAPAEWLVWRRQNTVFSDLAGTQPADAVLSGGAEPDQVPARKATANLWSVLGVSPLLGRVFTEAEDESAAKVVVISYGLWQRRFGGSSDVPGRPIVINDETFTVIGVLPREFYFLPAADIDVWLPASFPPWMRTSFGWHDMQVVARLRPDVTMTSARESMNALSLQVTTKSTPGSHRVILTPLREEIAGKTETALTYSSPPRARFSWSRASISPTCSWPEAPHAGMKWSCARRSEPGPDVSWRSSSPKVSCCRCSARSPDSRWPCRRCSFWNR